MRISVLTTLGMLCIGFFLSVVFMDTLKSAALTPPASSAPEQTATAEKAAHPTEPPVATPTPLPTFVPPSEFRGPSGPPHIIGPKSNPPNY